MTILLRPNGLAERRGCSDLGLALYLARVRSSELLGVTVGLRSRKRAGEHNGISVKVAQPIFPVAVLAEAALLQSFDVQSVRASHGGIEVVKFKPEHDTVTIRTKAWVPERTMLVLYVPAMQLKDKLPIVDEALIFVTAVSAGAAKQLLVPAAARFDIVNAD
jgi:hypothetical protein